MTNVAITAASYAQQMQHSAEFTARLNAYARQIGCEIVGDEIRANEEQMALISKWMAAFTRLDSAAEQSSGQA